MEENANADEDDEWQAMLRQQEEYDDDAPPGDVADHFGDEVAE